MFGIPQHQLICEGQSAPSGNSSSSHVDIETEIEETGNVHIDHCSRCHLVACPFVDGFGCPIVRCPQCSTKLHECKVEEHVEEICPTTQVPCPNVSYGCTRLLRRRTVGPHIMDCPASVVVCSREWARKTVQIDDKLKLKQLGKGLLLQKFGDISDEELDLAAAASDQKVLVYSYALRRQQRVKLRDRIHKQHPLVPLREVYDENGLRVGQGGHEGDGDSSEEEREAKAAKLRSKRAMFANCYMCQVDPSSQHLHTLGSETVKYWLGRPVRKWPKTEEKLHHGKGLYIDFAQATVWEDKHLLFRKTLYIRRCLKVVHRREAGNHELSQHQIGLDALGEAIVRCPNWERGCEFRDSRLTPTEGRLRFLQHVDSVLHCPHPSMKATPSSVWEQCPEWVFEELAEYLPSSALYSLSLVSKRIRKCLIEVLDRKQMIEVVWKKTKGGGWHQDGYKCSFSIADAPCRLSWHPATALSSHLAICKFGEKKSFEESRVSVFEEPVISELSVFCSEFFQ